jgi:hypothetical protein
MFRVHTVHVISKDKTLVGGNIPDEQVTASINVLNADFAQSGVTSTLVNTTRALNATWFDSQSREVSCYDFLFGDLSSSMHCLDMGLKPWVPCATEVRKC